MFKARIIPDYNSEDVLSKIAFADNDMCWEWLGNIDQYGYGTYGKQNHMVHRVVYNLLVGELKPDETVDHLCLNRSCVNPNHLEAVPLEVNILRGNNPHAINKRKTMCLNGHEFTESNTYIHPKRGTRNCIICARTRSKVFQKERIIS